MSVMQADALESFLIGLAAFTVLIAIGSLFQWFTETIACAVIMKRKR